MTKKILVIEDDASLAKKIEFALKKDFAVTLADSGDKGLQIAKQLAPDLILLDVMLPDIDGEHVLKELKSGQLTKDIPVVILTNVGDLGTISRFLSSGGKDYMIKSDWSMEEVNKKVKELTEI